MKILFICTGNTCRSPMAEGLANKFASELKLPIEATSAGIMAVPLSYVSEFSVKALKEYNVDISNHIPTQLSQNLLDEADLVLTMTQAHKDIILNSLPQYKNKTYTLGEYTSSADISDPYGCDFETYKKCVLQIKTAILKLYERINSDE